ncbi:hypothetical protein Ddc_24282 [Ditylenchus destructor]|nr:hypothetical protein Ddc_24282 [Ditylenchus destructor]
MVHLAHDRKTGRATRLIDVSLGGSVCLKHLRSSCNRSLGRAMTQSAAPPSRGVKGGYRFPPKGSGLVRLAPAHHEQHEDSASSSSPPSSAGCGAHATSSGNAKPHRARGLVDRVGVRTQRTALSSSNCSTDPTFTHCLRRSPR